MHSNKKDQKVALVYNANDLIAKEIIKQLVKRGLKVCAVDSNSLFYVNELLTNNPELEDNIVPILLPRQAKIDELGSALAKDHISKIHLVVDLNLSERELVSDDYKFISDMIDSQLIDRDCVFCFGNAKTIDSPSTYKAANELVQGLEKEAESKLGEDHTSVINLLNPREPGQKDPENVASLYIDALLRSAFRVRRIANLMDVFYTFLYYSLPLTAYSYMEKTGKMFEDWTSPSLKDIGDEEPI
ncbi:DEKNAAC104825 [Brettanomyces naardenensis]|uniref:DEKNAAC104825 n=1 Tax=Brettanomyces naardenensis TaxID=13370 RepID=A0A448YS60_BRENA|nr:DEKNAAC104825 [Brettanomyces naardenensis]